MSKDDAALPDSKISALVAFVKEIYGSPPIPLHRPVFRGNERSYLVQTIDSNFVSSVGMHVTAFEERIAQFTGAQRAVATVNGTAAIHAALLVAGVGAGHEVITQALTFVATCNAITYAGAKPVFVDVDVDTMGLSPDRLRSWLEKNTKQIGGKADNRNTGAHISACVPMHTFGLPCRVSDIAAICQEFNITLIEDAAESLGSYIGVRHTGTFGRLATLSFNGNKVITTGGGGMILTDSDELANRAKHLTTTAKVPHAWEFVHDEVGYNYRMPNLNAALGCAQMEKLPAILRIKSQTAALYRAFCAEHGFDFIVPIEGATPNFWLNAIRLKDRASRDSFLKFTNSEGVMTRPIWTLMSELNAFADCETDGLEVSRWLADCVVNLPSSVPDNQFEQLDL